MKSKTGQQKASRRKKEKKISQRQLRRWKDGVSINQAGEKGRGGD